MAALARCPQLSSLNLTSCSKVTDAGVADLAERCPQLSSLNLSFCNQVTDAGVAALAGRCPQLSSLDLLLCYQVTDAGGGRAGRGEKETDSAARQPFLNPEDSPSGAEDADGNSENAQAQKGVCELLRDLVDDTGLRDRAAGTSLCANGWRTWKQRFSRSVAGSSTSPRTFHGYSRG